MRSVQEEPLVELWSVNFWGSEPGTNDDCWTGFDFKTEAEARAAYSDPKKLKEDSYCPLQDAAWIELALGTRGGTGVLTARTIDSKPNPDYEPPVDTDDWRQEPAMQAGMAFGCDGYNDMMGY